MTVLLVLSMLTIFLLVDALIQRMHSLKTIAQKDAPHLAIPDGRTLALNHMWVKEEDDGSYTLGLDAFLGNIVGRLDKITLPDTGTLVTPASKNIGLAQGGRMLQLSSPISGRILEVNRKLLHDPSRLFKDPYGNGWFARIRAKAGTGSPTTFVMNPSEWVTQQVDTAKSFFASRLDGHQAAFMQDGGGLADGVLQRFHASVSGEFQEQFLSLPDADSSKGRTGHGNK